MEQDIVSSGSYPLYDALMREYHPTWGRWLSPDPAGLAVANPANPQSWNRYAYVVNNPLIFTDPLGLGPCDRSNPPPFCNGPPGRAGNPPDVAGLAAVCFEHGLWPGPTGCVGSLESSELAGAEAAWASQMNLQWLSQSGVSHNGSWTLGGTTYTWVPPSTTQPQPVGDSGTLFAMSMVTGHWQAANTGPDFYQFTINIGDWYGFGVAVTGLQSVQAPQPPPKPRLPRFQHPSKEL